MSSWREEAAKVSAQPQSALPRTNKMKEYQTGFPFNAPVIGPALKGFDAKAQRSWGGAMQLFSDDPRYKAMVQDADEILTEDDSVMSPKAVRYGKKAGALAADLGTYGGPSMAVSNVLRGLPSAAATAARVPVQAGAAAATGYATEPDNRAGAAMAAGAGAGVGEAAGALAGRLITQPVKPSPAAVRLMNQGVQPTIGQGADKSTMLGRLVGAIEEGASHLPGTGTLVERGREKANQGLRSVVLRKSTPPGRDVPEGMNTREQLGSIDDLFREEYGNLRSARVPPQYMERLYNSTRELGRSPSLALRPRERTEFVGETLPGIAATRRAAPGGSPTLKQLKDNYVGGIEMAKDRPITRPLTEAYDGALERADIVERRVLGPQGRATREGLNDAYTEFLRASKAAGGARTPGGNFDAADYVTAVRGEAPSQAGAAFSFGRAPGQELADDAFTVMGQPSASGNTTSDLIRGSILMSMLGLGGGAAGGPVGAGLGVGVGAAVPIISSSQRLSKAALGGYPAQQALRSHILRAPHLTPAMGAIAAEELRK